MAVISRLASVRSWHGFVLLLFFFSSKAQEIDVPLASTGWLATELSSICFPQRQC